MGVDSILGIILFLQALTAGMIVGLIWIVTDKSK